MNLVSVVVEGADNDERLLWINPEHVMCVERDNGLNTIVTLTTGLRIRLDMPTIDAVDAFVGATID